MLRAGILGFVDKDVIDAAVQLVEHPFGRRLAGQQIFGLQDQVFEIQYRAAGLRRFVALVDSRAEPGQGRAALNGAQAFLAVV